MKLSTRTKKTRKADHIATRLSAIFLIGFFLCSASYAEEDFESPGLAISPRVETAYNVSKHRLRLDEEIVFSLKIRWRDESEDIKFVTPELKLKNLTLVSLDQSAETYYDGQSQVRERILTFHLRPLETGPAGIDSFKFLIGAPESTAFEGTEIEAQQFEVLPDWKPLLRIAAGLAVAVAFIVMFFFSVKVYARRHPPQTPALSKEEQLIGQLKLDGTLDAKNAASYVGNVALVFKNYLKHRYGLSDAGMGGLDLKEAISRRRDIPASDKDIIVAILHQLTESRFAGSAPSAEQAQLLSGSVLNFIEGKKIVG